MTESAVTPSRKYTTLRVRAPTLFHAFESEDMVAAWEEKFAKKCKALVLRIHAHDSM